MTVQKNARFFESSSWRKILSRWISHHFYQSPNRKDGSVPSRMCRTGKAVRCIRDGVVRASSKAGEPLVVDNYLFDQLGLYTQFQ